MRMFPLPAGTADGVDVDARTAGTSGFTLIEIVIAVGVVVTLIAGSLGIAQASRSFAVSAAATEFDRVLDAARTIAREVDGATIAFAPDAYGDGTEVRVLTRGAGGTLSPTTLPPMHTRATVEEVQNLGKAPFGFVVHANGTVAGRPGFRAGDAASGAEIGCPPSGSFHFTLHTAGASADRIVPCRIDLASSGPVTRTTWPSPPVAAPPTPCAGPCNVPILPGPPASAPTCPPAFASTVTGCTPTTTVSGSAAPHYHVTASVASPTITVGSTTTVTASAVLTNRGDVSTSTPATVPVKLISWDSPLCRPSASLEESGQFTIEGIAEGKCSVVATGDLAQEPGATTDTASIAIAVSASPSTACDRTFNSRCYRRIFGPEVHAFTKTTYPKVACSTDQSCSYDDATERIQVSGPFVLSLDSPAPADTYNILFEIDSVSTVEDHCIAYDDFAGVVTPPDLPWLSGTGSGGSTATSAGSGEPATFIKSNYVEIVRTASYGIFDEPVMTWPFDTTFSDMYAAAIEANIGPEYDFTFSAHADAGNNLTWYADFPGCDRYTANDVSGRQYGVAVVSVVLQLYEASGPLN